MNAIAEVKPASELVPMGEAASLMEVISRAASDPNTDVDKLERLMAMYERITDRGAKSEYSAALANMQPHLPVVERNGRIVIRDKNNAEKIIQSTPYALWEDIADAIRPLLAEHRFALSFKVGKDADRVVVTAILSHASGHSEQTELSLPMDTSGSKNNVQAIGSSVSYGKRYTATALLNITTRGEDDDGKAAGEPAKKPSGGAGLDGADWWGAEGFGPSASQAKKDGLGEKFDLIRNEIKDTADEAALREVCREHHLTVVSMPKAWRVSLRGEAEEQALEIGFSFKK